MKLALSIVLALVAGSCSTPDRHRPELALSTIVALENQPAEQVAARVCALLHGVVPGSPQDRAGGCTSREHAVGHHADGSSHVSLVAEAASNAIVVTVPPGRDEDLARAVALVRELDKPATARK